jgi:hypothetical protein
MPKYQIVTPHDDAQCVQALDEMLAHDPDFQSQVVFGCHFGDHTGYALIEASDEAEARSKLPRSLVGRARVVGVEHFSPEEIKSDHDRPI